MGKNHSELLAPTSMSSSTPLMGMWGRGDHDAVGTEAGLSWLVESESSIRRASRSRSSSSSVIVTTRDRGESGGLLVFMVMGKRWN